MKQQRAIALAEGQIAQLIQDDEVCEQQPLCNPARFPIVLFTFQQIDQVYRGEEADSFVVDGDSGYSQCAGQVCFACSRAADEIAGLSQNH
jgi:hypothetical protein